MHWEDSTLHFGILFEFTASWPKKFLSVIHEPKFLIDSQILFASVLSNKNDACIVTNIAVLLSSTTVQKLLSEIMTIGDMLLIHNEHGHQSWFVLLYTRSDIRKPNRYSSTAENSQTNWPLFLCKWYVIWHPDFCRFFFFLMSVRKDELGSEQFKQCREDVKKEQQTKV